MPAEARLDHQSMLRLSFQQMQIHSHLPRHPRLRLHLPRSLQQIHRRQHRLQLQHLQQSQLQRLSRAPLLHLQLSPPVRLSQQVHLLLQVRLPSRIRHIRQIHPPPDKRTMDISKDENLYLENIDVLHNSRATMA